MTRQNPATTGATLSPRSRLNASNTPAPIRTRHKIGTIEVLTSRLLVQRLFDALGRCSLGLGILDRRFG
jgi:hypothetical protein